MTGLPSLAPVVAILVLAWRLRALVRAFVRLEAFSPESAVPATSLEVRRGPIFRRLLRRGVIATAGGDRYYLDQARYREWRSTRRRRALIVLAAVTLLIATAWVAGWIDL